MISSISLCASLLSIQGGRVGGRMCSESQNLSAIRRHILVIIEVIYYSSIACPGLPIKGIHVVYNLEIFPGPITRM